jgi:glycosyltransferase involved in cell wall biosynthesis
MKILVVSQYFWPENFRINELVAEWIKRGNQVTVLTGLPNYPDGRVFACYRAEPDAYAAYAGARVVRVPIVPRRKGKLWLVLNYLSFTVSASLLGAWRLRGGAVDVIFVFEPSPILVGVPSAFLRWLKRAPQAFWVLDLWPETLKAVGVLKAQWMLNTVGCLVRWIYTRCDLVLAQSRSFIGDIARHSPDRHRIEYFPAWAESTFSSRNLVLAPEIPEARGVFTVMFAGNIGEAQDFPAILDAVEALKAREDIRWIIVGDGRMAEWVRRQIEVRGLGVRARMVGRYPLERMPSFFAHADALLVSLKDEPIFSLTIPGKLPSYLAAGIPVLAMLDGEGANIVEEARAGFVCRAGDSAGLATIVVKMASMDISARKEMGENGRRFCEREFDRDRQIERLEKWLAELVESNRLQRNFPA